MINVNKIHFGGEKLSGTTIKYLGDCSMQWKVIDGFENYEVSDTGLVRNKNTGYILKPSVNHNGYHRIELKQTSGKKKFFVHRLVGEAFVDNVSNLPQINHKDGKKKNNSAVNLEWVTGKQNQKHARKLGLFKNAVNPPVRKGEKNNKCRYSDKKCIDIIEDAKKYGAMRTAERHKVSFSYVYRLAQGKVRKNLRGYR